MELFLAAHEKYHEWGAFGKCTSLFEFVSDTFTSFIGSGQTLTNTNANIGQETVAPVAAPNTDDGLLTSVDDVLQRYASS